jgi:hypothetical protein
MSLDYPASMVDDIFTQNIFKVISMEYIKTVIDVGAHNGDSSTLFIFNAMKDKPVKKLYALEPQIVPFKNLSKRYKDFDWVLPINKMTGKISDYHTLEEIRYFYNNMSKFKNGSLNRLPFSYLTELFLEEINYLKTNNISEDGLDFIIKDIGGLPDAIMLDGSSYTKSYRTEFPKYCGTKVLILDDTRCLKNMEIRNYLINDSSYNCFYDDLTFRFGVSIFIKK